MSAAMTTPNALTVDVEEYFQVEALARVVDRDEWDRLESRVAWQTSVLLDLFARENVRATFFTLGWVARRHPALIRRVVSEGHELACHGDGHRMITQMSRDEFRADIRAAKATLEDIGGVRVDGYRAPTFSVVEETRWALDTLRDEGFTYDASVFPIRHDRYGIPTAPRAPHRISGPGEGLVEFPSSTIRVAGRNLPVGGGGYLRLLPMAYTRWALDRVAAERSPFMVYLHPWEIDAQLPRFPMGRIAEVRSHHNIDQIIPRLTELMRAYPFAPARTVLRSLGLLPEAEAAAAVAAA